MSAMKNGKQLPEKLQHLVSWSVDILGKAIKLEYGPKAYNRIEKLRANMKELRKAHPDKLYTELLKEQKKIQKLQTSELEEIALSFTFMLELINSCENAYRASQLEKREFQEFEKKPYAVIMVLTAHPTEARSPEVLTLFTEIQKVLIHALKNGLKNSEADLYHLLLLALKLSIARRKKPSVFDEAQNIYSYILRPDILQSLIQFNQNDVNLSFRAWVGGDKDGHPGVDEKTMKGSLTISRNMLIDFIHEKLAEALRLTKITKGKEKQALMAQFKTTTSKLKRLRALSQGDGYAILDFKEAFLDLRKNYRQYLLTSSPRLEEIEALLWVFPAMVVPLELREDSEEVANALNSKSPMAISRMLQTLKEISQGFDAKWYVRGFILSMVESHEDILNGHKLLKDVFGTYEIPVVPLFENEKALTNAKSILNKLFEAKTTIPREHIARWGGRFEVMIGYSDSSKENGVFPSRLMIADALDVIEKTLKRYKLTPVFFHGSGGSIERGGGSIKEQTKWWPISALNTFKATTQGEMVARNFGNQYIFSSHVDKIVEQLNFAKLEKVKYVQSSSLESFSKRVRHYYSSTVKSSSFFEVIDSATPYSFLSHLKIGSRPSKRSTGGDSRKLRAIPWILCWTQTRVLFPTWWGTGSAWQDLTSAEKKDFKKQYKENPLISSFMNALGFTLAKVEFGVWKIYLENSRLDKEDKKKVYQQFIVEYESSLKFYKDVTGQSQLLWFKPWLQQSIDYRSSMIHPLNLIQIESLKRKEIALLQDTVTGISCGMLTTG